MECGYNHAGLCLIWVRVPGLLWVTSVYIVFFFFKTNDIFTKAFPFEVGVDQHHALVSSSRYEFTLGLQSSRTPLEFLHVGGRAIGSLSSCFSHGKREGTGTRVIIHLVINTVMGLN